jgi:acetylornithine deacetylase/succinyl-diaminopimelate desuccinylase-like protein
MLALELVIAERGRLGFNSTFMIETSEEIGSPGLAEFCAEHRNTLAADLLIGSDGPRLAPDRPTIFGGTRGALNFDLAVNLRAGGHCGRLGFRESLRPLLLARARAVHGLNRALLA